MRKTTLLFIVAVFLLSQAAFAGDIGFSYNSNTGDKELDISLGDLNLQAKGDMENFINSLSVSYGVKKEKVEKLVEKEDMPPADVYMVIKVAKVAESSIEDVVNVYRGNKKKGWGFIAKKMGIKPGSIEFHALKDDDSGMLGEKGKSKKGKEKKSKEKGKGKK